MADEALCADICYLISVICHQESVVLQILFDDPVDRQIIELAPKDISAEFFGGLFDFEGVKPGCDL